MTSLQVCFTFCATMWRGNREIGLASAELKWLVSLDANEVVANQANT